MTKTRTYETTKIAVFCPSCHRLIHNPIRGDGSNIIGQFKLLCPCGSGVVLIGKKKPE